MREARRSLETMARRGAFATALRRGSERLSVRLWFAGMDELVLAYDPHLAVAAAPDVVLRLPIYLRQTGGDLVNSIGSCRS